MCTVVGFYRYAEEEGVIEHSPAVHIRRPRIDYESHVAHLDRNELGAILVTAGLSSPRDHALVSLLALNGLRVSEAIGANIEALGQERGHRTLTVLRKGGKLVTMPLAPRVARAIDLAVGERLDGPIFIDTEGQRLDRHAAGRIVRRIARRAEIGKRVGPHTLRHAFITAALDAGVPLRDVQEAASHADPRTTMRYDRGRQSLDRHATYIVATFVAGAIPLTDPPLTFGAAARPRHRASDRQTSKPTTPRTSVRIRRSVAPSTRVIPGRHRAQRQSSASSYSETLEAGWRATPAMAPRISRWSPTGKRAKG